MSSASNFVNIDDTTPIIVPGRSATFTAAQILRGAGFPVETGNVPYDVRTNSLLAKIDHQLNPDQRLTFRFNYADGFNENIEPFGGQVARSRARLARQPRRHGGRVAHRGDLQPDRQRAALPVRAARPGGAIARSAVRRRVRPRYRGRADARSGRLRERRAAALHAAASPERSLSGARHDQPVHGQAPAQGRLRLQLHRSQGAVAAAALRRALHLPAAAGDSRRAAGAGVEHPGARARPAGGLRAGLWRLRRCRTATATSRCSCRTTGG